MTFPQIIFKIPLNKIDQANSATAVFISLLNQPTLTTQMQRFTKQDEM